MFSVPCACSCGQTVTNQYLQQPLTMQPTATPPHMMPQPPWPGVWMIYYPIQYFQHQNLANLPVPPPPPPPATDFSQYYPWVPQQNLAERTNVVGGATVGPSSSGTTPQPQTSSTESSVRPNGQVSSGLLNALSNLEREYETAVVNEVFRRAAAPTSSGTSGSSGRRRMRFQPPHEPHATTGQPLAPRSQNTQQAGRVPNHSRHPLTNSLVFNSSGGLGFLADPSQLTALFANIPGGLNDMTVNYTRHTTYIPMQIDADGNLIMMEESTWETDHGVSSNNLTSEEINQLPTFSFTSGADQASSPTTCIVCQNAFQNSEILTRLPTCSHTFHSDCIRPWLQIVNTCPVCRAPVTLNSDPVQTPNRGGGSNGNAENVGHGEMITEEEDSDDIPEPPSP